MALLKFLQDNQSAKKEAEQIEPNLALLEAGLGGVVDATELSDAINTVESLSYYMDSLNKIATLEDKETQKVAMSCLFASDDLQELMGDTVEASMEGMWDNISAALTLSFKNLVTVFKSYNDKSEKYAEYAKNLTAEIDYRYGEPNTDVIKLNNFVYETFVKTKKDIYAGADEVVKVIGAVIKDPLSKEGADFSEKLTKAAKDKSANFKGWLIFGYYYNAYKYIADGSSEMTVGSLKDIEKDLLLTVSELKKIESIGKELDKAVKAGPKTADVEKSAKAAGYSEAEARAIYNANTKAAVSIIKQTLETTYRFNNDSLTLAWKQISAYPRKKNIPTMKPL